MGWRIIGKYFGHAWHVKYTDTAFCTSESMNSAIISFWQNQVSYVRGPGQLEVHVLEYGPMQLTDRIVTESKPWRNGEHVLGIKAFKLDYGKLNPVQLYNPLRPNWDVPATKTTNLTKETPMQIRSDDKVEEGQLFTVNRKDSNPLGSGGCPVIYEATLITSQGVWGKRVTNPVASSVNEQRLTGKLTLLDFVTHDLFKLSDEEFTKLTGRTFPRPPKRIVERLTTKCHTTKIGDVTRHVVQFDSSVHGDCIARFYDVDPDKANYRAHQFILGLVDDPKLRINWCAR